MPMRIVITPKPIPARGPKYLKPSNDVNAMPTSVATAIGNVACRTVESSPPSTQSATIAGRNSALTHRPLPSQNLNQVVSAPCHWKSTDFISPNAIEHRWLLEEVLS